ncbi:glycosyltransferase family 4 protein [Levilinea saccharolytica]|nr:glycosyltransferase family 4 protein [Levilinea saccharolytica]GAP17880.1 glycosyltransferase [Levilinea saccharolytica]
MNSPFRVAMIIQGYHPRVGGAERQLAAVAPRLQARGLDVHVLTRRYPGLAAEEIVNGVPVHRLPIPGPKRVGSLVFLAAALLKLRQLRPQVIHAHELLSPTTTALAARRLWKTPVVAKVLRGGAVGDLAKLRRNSLSASRLRPLQTQVDRFIVVSREIDRELEAAGIPPQRRAFIPNGVDCQRFAPATPEQKAAARAQLGLPANQPVLVFTGRIDPEKNLALLLSLWPQIRLAAPQASLLLVGDGEQAAELCAASPEGVLWPGKVTDPRPYLHAADIFVLPSLTEGLSNALLEGMACGLAPVSSHVGGSEDVILPGVNGCLVPANDGAALQEALVNLVSHPDICARMGAASRERIAQEYDLETTVARLHHLYLEVTPQRSQPS